MTLHIFVHLVHRRHLLYRRFKELVTSLYRIQDALDGNHAELSVFAVCCFNTCRIVSECISMAENDPVWSFSAHDANQLHALMVTYRTTTFPRFLQHLVSSLSEDRFTNSAILGAMACTGTLLRLGAGTWPHNLANSQLLIRSVSELATRLRPSHVDEVSAGGILDFLSNTIADLATGTALHIPGPMLNSILLAAGLIGRKALTITSINAIPRSLATLIISGRFLELNQHISRSVTADTCAVVAKLAILTLSRCSNNCVPASLRPYEQFMSLMLDMDLNRGDIPIMDIIRALHLCRKKYPPLSSSTSNLVMQQHRQSSCNPDAGRAIVYSLRISMQSVVSWMHPLRQESCQVQHTFIQEIDIINTCISLLTVAVFSLGEEGSTLAIDSQMYVIAWLSHPVVLNGMEALFRGGQHLSPSKNLVLLMTISSVALFTFGAVSSQSLLESLMRTIHKGLLIIRSSEAEESIAWNSPPMQMLAFNMSKIMAASELTMEVLSESYRIYMLAGVSLLPLLRKLGDDIISKRARSQFTSCHERHPVPDCQLEIAGWAGPVAYYSRHFRGRILYGCSYLGCKNLGGVLDSLLKTRRCGRCRRVQYCCEHCHAMDWYAGGHSQVCGSGEWNINAYIQRT